MVTFTCQSPFGALLTVSGTVMDPQSHKLRSGRRWHHRLHSMASWTPFDSPSLITHLPASVTGYKNCCLESHLARNVWIKLIKINSVLPNLWWFTNSIVNPNWIWHYDHFNLIIDTLKANGWGSWGWQNSKQLPKQIQYFPHAKQFAWFPTCQAIWSTMLFCSYLTFVEVWDLIKLSTKTTKPRKFVLGFPETNVDSQNAGWDDIARLFGGLLKVDLYYKRGIIHSLYVNRM
jgi:hypothetical protein